MVRVKAQKIIFKDKGEKMDKQKELKEVVEIDMYRRITGYVVPNVHRWGDGKRAELKDRVKHVGVKEKED